MTPWLDAGLCAVLTLQGKVVVDGVGWKETFTYTVRADDGCDAIDMHLPDGVHLEAWSAHVRPLNDKNYRLDAARLSRPAHTPDGARTYRWAVPELDPGDVLRLRVTRRWAVDVPYRWTPGRDGVDYAELRLQRGLVPATEGIGLDGRIAWAREARAEDALTLPHPWAQPDAPPVVGAWPDALAPADAHTALSDVQVFPAAAFGRSRPTGKAALALGATSATGWHATFQAMTGHPPEDGRTPDPVGPSARWHGHIDVTLEGADPIRTIGEGRRARIRETHVASWPGDAAGYAFLPVPHDGTAVDEGSARCDHVRLTPDGVWLTAAPGTTRCEVTLVRPMVDAWGVVPDAWTQASAAVQWRPSPGDARPGEAIVEQGTWRLTRLDGHDLLTDTTRRALAWKDRRYAVSLPEPAVPIRARGGRSGWDLAAAVGELIAWRAIIHPLPIHGAHPRPLQRARRTRVLTAPEAALVGALHLRQGRVRADAVLVRRLDHPAAGSVAPWGFDDALILVEHDGGRAWIDPACAVCAPFEVRPELMGQEALGGGIDAIPRPRFIDGLPVGIGVVDGLWARSDETLSSGVGWWTVAERLGDETVPLTTTWSWEGADALDLRRDLAALPSAERRPAIAAMMHATRAPIQLDGTGTAGAPITAATSPDRAFTVDPLEAPGGPIVGIRAWTRPGPPGSRDKSWSCEGPAQRWSWRAAVRGEHLTEQLLRRDATWSDEDDAALRACRERLADPETP